jgi:hypothetical protein
MRAGIVSLLMVAGLLSGCADKRTETAQAGQELVFRPISAPMDSLARYPHLLADEETGRLWMSWMVQHSPDSASVWLSGLNSSTGEWQQPELVTAGDKLFVNWADYPHVMLNGKEAGVLYLQVADPTAPYAYHVMWKGVGQAPRRIHEDSSATEHGFVSTAPLPNGQMATVWLDGHKYAGAEGGHDDHHGEHGGGEMTMRFRPIAADGSMLPALELDGRTCDCCNTALISTSKGALAFYRDRSPEEIRDIYYMRYQDGQWTEPKPLHEDKWEMRACPVNGPAADARGEQVAAAWYTAANGKPRVNVRFSADGGETWGPVVVADSLQPMGRVGIKLLEGERALLSWLNKDGQLMVQQVQPQGSVGKAQALADSLSSRKSGFPQLVRLKNKVYLAWTKPDPSTQVQLLEASLAQE